MINLFNWVTTLVESFTFYGGGKGGGGGGNTAGGQAQDFFGVGARAPYADMLNSMLLTGQTSSGQPISQWIQQQPGYQFGMQQGTQALTRQQAATGMTGSGSSSVALQNYGQQYANQYMQQMIGNLMPASGAGTAPMNLGQPSSTGMQSMMGLAGGAIGYGASAGWFAPAASSAFDASAAFMLA